MNIVIDLIHPADVNFYKNAINMLIEDHNNIIVVVRPRGRLISILENELPFLDFTTLGEHYSTMYGKIFGLFKRDLELIHYLKKIDFDISTSFGFQICHASRILGKPSISFDDDYEYKIPFYLAKFSATRYIMPEYIPATGKNIYKYKGFKELAYLHPDYFVPNKKILDKYNVKPSRYVFIREITNTSLNYRYITENLHTVTKYVRDLGFQILVSLENKDLAEHFQNNCIILEEPIEDIYSLLKFAAFTISSGDTMARESCLVGTPTIYTGGRDMAVNAELILKKCMFKVDDIENVPAIIDQIVENDLKPEVTKIIEHEIKFTWEDTTKIILENLLDVKNVVES